MWMAQSPEEIAMRVSSVVLCSLRIGLLLVPVWGIGGGTPAEALDVTGKWLLGPGIPNPVAADFAQSGSNLSIDAGLLLSGTIDSAAGTFVAAAGDLSTCEYGLGGLIVGEARLVGTSVVVGAACGFIALPAGGERCECFDGNTVSGDGCDARC
jgi:hypothetical protein